MLVEKESLIAEIEGIFMSVKIVLDIVACKSLNLITRILRILLVESFKVCQHLTTLLMCW